MSAASGWSPVPDHVPEDLVQAFDHHREPCEAADCFSPFDRLHDKARVIFSPLHGGFWVLTRSADIQEAVHRPDVFSSHPVGIPSLQGYPRKLIPEELDPPEHGKYRKPLAEPFSPAAVKNLGEAIDSVCVSLIDPLVDRGSCEFLKDFAKPFPTMIFVQRLGLPYEESEKFGRWTDQIIHAIDPVVRQEGGSALTMYLTELIEKRTKSPHDDLISHLLASEVDGRSMTAEEVLDTCFLLFIAGLDTVTAALGFTFRFLAENPQCRRQLVDGDASIADGVEEILRLHAIVNPARYLTQDVEFAGVRMKKGDAVLCSSPTATRDPAVFPNPTMPNLSRRPNTHTAFGAGPHRCLGSHLARRELTAAVKLWLERIPDFSIPAGVKITAHGGDVMGIDHLPLVWS